jgi:hypothetical protein
VLVSPIEVSGDVTFRSGADTYLSKISRHWRVAVDPDEAVTFLDEPKANWKLDAQFWKLYYLAAVERHSVKSADIIL